MKEAILHIFCRTGIIELAWPAPLSLLRIKDLGRTVASWNICLPCHVDVLGPELRSILYPL